MDIIKFYFDETNEEVNFAVIGSVEHDENVYLMVVEEEELDEEDMTAYILKAIEVDEEEVIYEIVDDEEELSVVTELFEEYLENYDFDQE